MLSFVIYTHTHVLWQHIFRALSSTQTTLLYRLIRRFVRWKILCMHKNSPLKPAYGLCTASTLCISYYMGAFCTSMVCIWYVCSMFSVHSHSLSHFMRFLRICSEFWSCFGVGSVISIGLSLVLSLRTLIVCSTSSLLYNVCKYTSYTFQF